MLRKIKEFFLGIVALFLYLISSVFGWIAKRLKRAADKILARVERGSR